MKLKRLIFLVLLIPVAVVGFVLSVIYTIAGSLHLRIRGC
jgi:hypothetical protein